MSTQPKSGRQFQSGAALVVGLILLVVVTVLAISGMNTATTELAIARNDQNREYAFQAAETGLEQALSQGAFTAAPAATVKLEHPIDEDGHNRVTTIITFKAATPPPPRPPGPNAFTLNKGRGFAAYHFVAEATAEAPIGDGTTVTDRDTSAVHTQAFYIVGPEAPTL